MEVQCPTCSARFKVPDTVSVATCPYCGTTFHVHTGEKSEEEHFFFPPMRKDAGGVLLKFLSRQYGAPADITGARITKKELHWVPVYFFYLHGRSTRWSTIEEVRFLGLPAASRFMDLLDHYPFPIRGKRFFDESIVKKGRYYEPELDREKAESMARKEMESALRSEAMEEDKSVGGMEIDVRFLGLVHYPIWEVHYEYGGDSFAGYVDGTDGRVILGEYPLMSSARKKATVLGAGVLATGLVFGVAAAGAYGSAWGLIGGLIPAGVGAFGIFSKGSVKRRKVSEVMRTGGGNLYFKPMR
ncbi:zinc ribbon domain-containing protein [Thermococcus camini]|uniref:TFIIB-type domain-containing protein n=1 Tax=Thermococcus camini TaxID=2016373 RepID=A0A7G2D8F7_9EURY|nr:hypothetical protein [Thermococcus camini]CAD5244166.1 conserved protein of unknown function [Thermococcus camini]